VVSVKSGQSGGISQFDCSKHGGAIQVLKNSNGGYNVSELDVATGDYNLIYELPPTATTPGFTFVNAVAINPKDSKAYGVFTIGGKSYLGRFDENGVELVGHLPIDGAPIAGAFSPEGNFYFSKGAGVVHSLGAADVLAAGVTDVTLAPDLEPASFPVQFSGSMADVVVIRGDFDKSGSEADYVMGISSATGMTVLKVTDEGVGTQFDVGLTGASGKYPFGAAWNFHGEVYFASNKGEGVFLIPTADMDLSSASTIEMLDRGDSVSTTNNDGMNCLTTETPFPACGPGEVEVTPAADGSCPPGSTSVP